MQPDVHNSQASSGYGAHQGQGGYAPPQSYGAQQRSGQGFAAAMSQGPGDGQSSAEMSSRGRPPVAPGRGSAKEEYAAALRAQMAEKDARAPRSHSRGRVSTPPESAHGGQAYPGQPGAGHNYARAQQDQRTAQMEYAAALQQQMADNSQRRASSRPQRDSSYAPPAAQPTHEAPMYQYGGNAGPQREEEKRNNQLAYAADLKAQMEANAARRGPSRSRREPEDHRSGMNIGEFSQPPPSGQRDQRAANQQDYANALRAQMAEKADRRAPREHSAVNEQAPRPSGGFSVQQPPGGFSHGLW